MSIRVALSPVDETGEPGSAQSIEPATLGEAVSRLASLAGDRRDPVDRDGVVLDVEYQGLRCVLIRMHAESPGQLLSPREVEIARLVCAGHSNKIIAGILEISSWTVGTHLRRIFVKLGVGTRAAMAAKIHELGLHIEGLSR
jgi:DNA-binding CsgD family transcriptional regulator